MQENIDHFMVDAETQHAPKIKVSIVDDNDDMRKTIEKIICISERFELVGSYHDVHEAIVLIPLMETKIVILDLHMGNGQSGIECIRSLKPDNPELHFMICTVFEDDERIFDAFCAGANGYLLKRNLDSELLRALMELTEGGSPMSAMISRKVINIFQVNDSGGYGWNPIHAKKGCSLPGLSKRENEILQYLSQGLLYKEIAAALFISSETVRKHVYHIYEKLHVGNRVEAINKYFRRT
jgi:DNA-binding NarL/FixJ family response regulator